MLTFHSWAISVHFVFASIHFKSRRLIGHYKRGHKDRLRKNEMTISAVR